MRDAQQREAPAPRGWVERYLGLLEVEHSAPSPEALARLTRAHVGAVLFENVTSILRRRAHPTGPVPPVDPEALLESWERGRGGGACFELAEMFARLLVGLGYQAHPVLGDMKFPGAHQAVLVDLYSRRYLADVGNGAPFFEPIPLEGAHTGCARLPRRTPRARAAAVRPSPGSSRSRRRGDRSTAPLPRPA